MVPDMDDFASQWLSECFSGLKSGSESLCVGKRDTCQTWCIRAIALPILVSYRLALTNDLPLTK